MQPSLEYAFRLPTSGWPRAVFQSDYAYGECTVLVEGERVLRCDRRHLEEGVSTTLPSGETLSAQFVDTGDAPTVELRLARDGATPVRAVREDQILAPPSRSAWVHAVIALAGSAAGFIAGYLYLLKAQHLDDAWALKMAYHTAGWHLLLTFTLFPASVWGQRLGIRTVQLISLIFFFIHVGIAIANGSWPDSAHDGFIAILNAVSGVLFLASVVYGQRAHRDMDPVVALMRGRV